MKEHKEVLKRMMSFEIRVCEAENSEYNKPILHSDTMAAGCDNLNEYYIWILL